ncbi:MAG: hypothetical protein JWR46_3499 [Mycobacterium sp.]|nr:hypothetical protein [Mycobacterium sp.]
MLVDTSTSTLAIGSRKADDAHPTVVNAASSRVLVRNRPGGNSGRKSC